MELAGKERAQSLLQPSRYDSVKVYYQSVCEAQWHASQRNTALLADLCSLRQRLQLAKDVTSAHITRLTSLKYHYEAYVMSAYTEWVRLTAQQPSTTLCHRHDDRQPDSLTIPEKAHSPIPNHTLVLPPAPIASSTLLESYAQAKPHPLADAGKSTVLKAEPTLLSQLNDVAPNAHWPVGELVGEFRHTESKSNTPCSQEEIAKGKEDDAKKALVESQTITAKDEHSITTDVRTTLSVRQTPAVSKGAVSLSAGKEVLVENGGFGLSVGEAELPRPHSTDPEQLLEELSLSSLSLSHTHPIDLSPPNTTDHSLDIHPDNVIPAVSASHDEDQLPTAGGDVLTEDLSISSHDDSMVEIVSASAVHPPARVEAARGREGGYSMTVKVSARKEMSSTLCAGPPQPPPSDSHVTAESASSTALAPSTLQNNPITSARRPEHSNIISTCRQDEGNVSAIQGEEESVSLSSSPSVSSSEHQAAASKEHISQLPNDRALPSGSLAATTNDRDLLEGQLTPSLTDGILSESDEDIVSTEDVEAGSRAAVRGGGRSGASGAIGSRAAIATVVSNLLSTLNRHLSMDAESADMMYTLPSSSDGMKGQINGSRVLTANITKMAADGRDLSTWEPGAISMVLLQQLSHMTNSMGSLWPQQLLEEDAPLLTSCDELSGHMTQQWSSVWPILLEHMQLLSGCGHSVAELASTLTPALVLPGNPAHREKARLQLLSILQEKVETSPQDASVEGEPLLLSESSSSQLSQAVSVQMEKRDRNDGTKVEMALTVFGEDDLSEQSSLLSEGSAIAQVERELQAAVMVGHKQRDESGKTSQKLVPPPSSLLPSFTSPPLHLHPSLSSSSDSDEDSIANRSPSSSSPSPGRNRPTALEERSSLLSSRVSNQSSLRRKLGLMSDSDSDGSTLEYSLRPPTTPLNNLHRHEGNGHTLASHSVRAQIEQDDFDFYD